MPIGLLAALAAAGLLAGLGLLVRGLGAQRSAARIGDTSSSQIGMLAAGEIRVTGEALAAGVTLTSPVAGLRSVYYHVVVRGHSGEHPGVVAEQSRAIGFFVRDGTGQIRVFPRGARWEIPLGAEVSDTVLDARWAGSGLAGLAFDEAVGVPLHPGRAEAPQFGMRTVLGNSPSGPARHDLRYAEARLGPGDIVTIVGRALPFRDLADPTEADLVDELPPLAGALDGTVVPDPAALQDPEVAADYAQALADGTLLADPASAWGNAAIEGFGIGQPVRPPELDPRVGAGSPPESSEGPTEVPMGTVAPEPVAPTLATLTGGYAVGPDQDFEIEPDALVIAAGPDIPLLIAAGSPGQAFERSQVTFLAGLLGAALAIGSALVLALAVSGTLGQ